jgi:hypothetical protein
VSHGGRCIVLQKFGRTIYFFKIEIEKMFKNFLKKSRAEQGSQNRGKPVGYRGNRPNRVGSVTKTGRTYEAELFG